MRAAFLGDDEDEDKKWLNPRPRPPTAGWSADTVLAAALLLILASKATSTTSSRMMNVVNQCVFVETYSR